MWIYFPDTCQPRCRCQVCQQRVGHIYVKRAYRSVLNRQMHRLQLRDADVVQSGEELCRRMTVRVNAEIAKAPLN